MYVFNVTTPTQIIIMVDKISDEQFSRQSII